MTKADEKSQEQSPSTEAGVGAELPWKQLAREHPELSRSLAVGLGVLECFGAEQGTLDLTELTEQLGVGSTATLRRYTAVLTAGGYLEQSAAARSYRLAAGAGDVALSRLETEPARRQARGALRRLRKHLGYTTSLVALDGAEAVYLDRCVGHRRGQYEIDRGIGVGARLPAYCTAAGKVLLANLPPSERRKSIATLTLEQRGPNSIRSKMVLRRELEGAARAGFALSDEDLQEGLRSIAAPVSDERGTVVAALEVSVPAEAVSCAALIESFSHLLRAAAGTIVVPADGFQGPG